MIHEIDDKERLKLITGFAEEEETEDADKS